MPPRKLVGVVSAAIVLILVVLAAFAPEQAVRETPETVITAEAIAIETREYLVRIRSFGRVQPRVSTKLVAQVSGRIIDISPQFRPGGRFEANEKLLWIEPADYRHAVTVAESQLARAKSQLSSEEALYAQAKRDWRRLGGNQKASALTLREPQLNGARAELAAAKAQLETARLNLQRTIISVPYSGRLRTQFVDVGQVVSPGTQLAEVYSDELLEIRLPVLIADVPYLPEIPRLDEGADSDAVSLSQQPSAILSVADGSGRQWKAPIVRREAGLDQSSYQHYLVARILADDTGAHPIVGQYLDAVIDGVELAEAIVVPVGAVYRNSYVWTLDGDSRLAKRPIEIAWRNDEIVLVASGVSVGERVVTTRLGYVLEGTKVKDPAAAS